MLVLLAVHVKGNHVLVLCHVLYARLHLCIFVSEVVLNELCLVAEVVLRLLEFTFVLDNVQELQSQSRRLQVLICHVVLKHLICNQSLCLLRVSELVQSPVCPTCHQLKIFLLSDDVHFLGNFLLLHLLLLNIKLDLLFYFVSCFLRRGLC